MKAGKAFESFNTVWQELVNLLKTLTLGSITIQFVVCGRLLFVGFVLLVV